MKHQEIEDDRVWERAAFVVAHLRNAIRGEAIPKIRDLIPRRGKGGAAVAEMTREQSRAALDDLKREMGVT